MADPFVTALSSDPTQYEPARAAATDAATAPVDFVSGDLGSLLAAPDFVRGSHERRNELFRQWQGAGFKRLAAEYGLDSKGITSVKQQARAMAKPYLAAPTAKLIDTDWWDKAATGLARGTANFIDAFSPNTDVANNARSDAERIEAAGFSDATKNRAKRHAELMQAAKNDGEVASAWQAAKNFADAPIQTLAEAGGAMLPILTAASLTGGAVVPAVAVGAGLGATQSLGAARQSTFELSQRTPLTTLRSNPDIAAMLDAGVPEEQVREEVGRQLTLGHLVAGVGGTISGALIGRVPVLRAGTGFVADAIGTATRGVVAPGSLPAGILSGAVEEGVASSVSKLGENIAGQPIDATIRAADGVLTAGTQGALIGAALGAAGGSAPNPGVIHNEPVTDSPMAPLAATPVDALSFAEQRAFAASKARADMARITAERDGLVNPTDVGGEIALAAETPIDALAAETPIDALAAETPIDALAAETPIDAPGISPDAALDQKVDDDFVDRVRRTAMLDGRLADDRQAALDDQASLASRHLDRLVGDVASADLMDANAAGYVFDREHAAWAEANPNAARQVSDEMKTAARERAMRLTRIINAHLADLPAADFAAWSRAQESRAVVPDPTADETAAALEQFIPERKNAKPQDQNTVQADTATGERSDSDATAGASRAGTTSSEDRATRTKSRRGDSLANPEATTAGREGSPAGQRRVNPAAAVVRENGDTTAASGVPTAGTGSRQVPEPAAGVSGSSRRGIGDQNAAGGRDSREPTRTGAGQGGLTPAQKRWNTLGWRDGEQIPFSALSERARDSWVSAVHDGDASREFAQELMKSAKPRPRETAADKDESRPITRAERSTARSDWNEEYGFAAEKTGDLNANDQVPFDDLSSERQVDWILTHRDPALSGRRDETVQQILRDHARNERRQRVQDRMKTNAEVDSANDLNREDVRRSRGDGSTPERDTNTSNAEGVRSNRYAVGDTEVPPIRPVGLQQARTAITVALAELPPHFGVPHVEVVKTPADAGMELPDGIAPYGVTMDSGRVVLFTDNIPSTAEAVRTLFHELLHRGVKSLFASNPEYTAAMRNLSASDARVREAASAWKNSSAGEKMRAEYDGQAQTPQSIRDDNFDAHATEEALAAIAEQLGSDKRVGIRFGSTARSAVKWLAGTASKLGMHKFAESLRNMTQTQTEKFIVKAFANATGTGLAGGPRYRFADAVRVMTTKTRDAATHAELFHEAATGEAPREARMRGAVDTVVEKLFDSTAPLLRMFGGDRTNDAFIAFNASTSQSNQRMLNTRDAWRVEVDKPIADFARQHGMDAQTVGRDVGNYAIARYAPEGNDELRQRHTEAQNEAQEIVDTVAPLVRADPLNKTYLSELARAEEELRDAKEWLDRYAAVDSVDRTTQTGELAARPDDRFIGGLTTAEAERLRATYEARYGDLAPGLVRLADTLSTFMRTSAAQAVEAGAIQPSELLGYSKSKNWIPTTGTVDEDPQASRVSASRSGVSELRTHQREGRASLATNPLESVMRKALALDRQSAMRPLVEALAAQDGTHGIHVVRASDSRRGLPFNRDVTTADSDGNVTTRLERMKVVFDDEHAMDAMLGTNRSLAAPFLRETVGKYTRVLSYMVTRAVPAFGPIAGFKDAAERAINIAANSPIQTNKARLFGDAMANYTSVPNLMAALASIRGTSPRTAAMDAVRELEQHTGFLTRNTQMSNDLNNLTDEIAKAAGGRRYFARIREFVHGWNEMWERSGQLAVYRALRAQGIDPRIAADTMLEAMNLNKTGSVAPVMQMFYPFFGARMSGGHHVARNLTTLRGWGVLGATVLAGMALYAMSKSVGGQGEDDEDGDALGKLDAITGVSLSRSVPLWLGGESYGKLPVPYGTGFVGWNIAIALSRLESGVWTPGQATEHIGMALMDEVSPLAPGPADPAKHPMWAITKSVAPEAMKKIVNVVANRNDFGEPLGRKFVDPMMPAWMQGSQKTGKTWHDWARTASGVVDATPEQWREMASAVIPMAQQIVKASDEESDAEGGDSSGLLRGLAQAAGQGRMIGIQKGTIAATFYQNKERAESDYRLAYLQAGPRPRSARGEREADVAQWLESTVLTDIQKQRIVALDNYNTGLRKIANGASRDDPEAGKLALKDIQKQFLAEIQQ